MSRAFDIAYILLMSALFIFLLADTYVSFEESAWKHRCRDAGGIPASHFICVNPGSVIEVD